MSCKICLLSLFMKFRLAVTICLLLTMTLPTLGAASPVKQHAAILAAVAPTLVSPSEGQVLSTFGPVLQWQNPSGTTQVHVQVIPINNDGPGVDLHLGTA